MNLIVIKSLFLFLGGVVMIGVGIYFTASHIEYLRTAEQTSGIVTEILSKRGAKGIKLYHPKVRYKPFEYEQSIQFTAKPGLWSWLYKIGEEVIVIYHPDNPQEAKIKSFWMLWFLPLVVTLFGLMCLFAGWHSWQKRS